MIKKKKCFFGFFRCGQYAFLPRGCSSVGRALEWHSRGQEFNSPQLHQNGNQGLRKRRPFFRFRVRAAAPLWRQTTSPPDMPRPCPIPDAATDPCPLPSRPALPPPLRSGSGPMRGPAPRPAPGPRAGARPAVAASASFSSRSLPALPPPARARMRRPPPVRPAPCPSCRPALAVSIPAVPPALRPSSQETAACICGCAFPAALRPSGTFPSSGAHGRHVTLCDIPGTGAVRRCPFSLSALLGRKGAVFFMG